MCKSSFGRNKAISRFTKCIKYLAVSFPKYRLSSSKLENENVIIFISEISVTIYVYLLQYNRRKNEGAKKECTKNL